jgi:hypothetical protein
MYFVITVTMNPLTTVWLSKNYNFHPTKKYKLPTYLYSRHISALNLFVDKKLASQSFDLPVDRNEGRLGRKKIH